MSGSTLTLTSLDGFGWLASIFREQKTAQWKGTYCGS